MVYFLVFFSPKISTVSDSLDAVIMGLNSDCQISLPVIYFIT